MMKFTNADDLSATAERLGLTGWYAQDSSGDYLGVLRNTDGRWLVGFTELSAVPFPISIDRVPR